LANSRWASTPRAGKFVVEEARLEAPVDLVSVVLAVPNIGGIGN